MFGCFLTICSVFSHIASRLFKSALPRKSVLLAIASSILILIGYWDILFPSARKTFISLSAETAGEICLCDVVVDGKNIPIAQVKVAENTGWLYREQYDNFMIWPKEDGDENCLTICLFASEIRLGFPFTPYAGSVTITSSAGDSETWDLSCPERPEGQPVEYADIPIDCRYVCTPLEFVLYGAGILSIIGFLCLILLNFSLRLPPLIILLMTHRLLFSIFPKVEPDKFTTSFLVLLIAASYLCLSTDRAHRLLKKYRTQGKTTVIVIIALYASLASFGQRFFLDGNTRMHFSAEGLFFVLAGMVWFIPVIYMLLFALELLASSCHSSPRPKRRRAFWMLLTILCLCQTIILWNFWPGGFPLDSIDLIHQAAGLRGIMDWHPAINAIFYRFILSICPHAGALVAVQLFFFALLCSEFLMLGYDYGISFKTLTILGVTFSLLPNQVIFGISPLKDYPYTLSLLWATYLLVRLALNPKELQRWQFFLALTLSLFLIYGFRHNGIMPFAALLLLFAWITFRYYPQVKLRLAAVSLSSILLISIYKGPVFALFHVSQDITMSPYFTMLSATASCVNKGLPLSKESTTIMESVLPLDQWATYYSRYHGRDPYYWGRGELAAEFPFAPSHITAREAFTVYLEALRKYPDVVIKDRLDGMDLLWDVRQPADGFNIKGFGTTVFSEEDLEVFEYFDFEPIEPGVSYYNHSFLSKIYRDMMNTAPNSVFDMLLWRSGTYLILLMILGLFWWGNRMECLLWATVPLLGQIAGLILVLCHQSYRFISAVQILTLALLFCSIFLRNGVKSCPHYEEQSGR